MNTSQYAQMLTVHYLGDEGRSIQVRKEEACTDLLRLCNHHPGQNPLKPSVAQSRGQGRRWILEGFVAWSASWGRWKEISLEERSYTCYLHLRMMKISSTHVVRTSRLTTVRSATPTPAREALFLISSTPLSSNGKANFFCPNATPPSFWRISKISTEGIGTPVIWDPVE